MSSHGYTMLFPFSEYWWFYAAFAAVVALLLGVDLAAHRSARPITMRSAAGWTAAWVSIGIGFGAVIYLLALHRYDPSVAGRVTLEYLAGYLVEESLSVDNMFVFALLFRYFSLGTVHQHRVLLFGILGAMVFRGMFVAAGSALIRFHWVVITFGALLVLSGIRLAFAKERGLDAERNLVMRFARRFLPVSGRQYATRFVVREAGVVRFTPLFVVLLVVESTDIAFAIDSVPAVFGVTHEPLLVYTSNVLAVLGLRSLYFVLSGALDLFHFLKYGLAVVLVFVGVKMAVLDNLAGGRLPIALSLTVIVATVLISIVLSLLLPAEAPRETRARVGRLAIGVVFASLSFLSLALAAGTRLPFLDPAQLASIKREWLFVTGLCYAACGWVLLRARPH